MRATFAVLVCSVAAGCGPHSAPPAQAPKEEQSYRDAIQLMCDADAHAGVTADDDPITAGGKRDDWMADHVKNSDAIYFRTLWRVKSAADKAVALRTEAKHEHIASCPLADTVEHDEF